MALGIRILQFGFMWLQGLGCRSLGFGGFLVSEFGEFTVWSPCGFKFCFLFSVCFRLRVSGFWAEDLEFRISWLWGFGIWFKFLWLWGLGS